MKLPKETLETKIVWHDEELTIREFFRFALRVALITDPQKRSMGDSGWLWSLGGELFKAGILKKGKIRTCDCDKEDWGDYCTSDGMGPCEFGEVDDLEEMDKQLQKLIDLL